MTTATISRPSPSAFLRLVLFTDAATCVLMGVLLCAASDYLGGKFNISSTFLFYAGASLFPCAALMAFAGTRVPRAQATVWLVIAGNIGWVVGSGLVIAAWFTPTTMGSIFVTVQAIAVVILAALEYEGLKRVR